MDSISQILKTLHLQANVFHNAQYCGEWRIDTSGSEKATFHIVCRGNCLLTLPETALDPVPLIPGDMVIFPRDLPHNLCDEGNSDTATNSATSITYDEGILDTGTGLVCGFLEFEHPGTAQLLNILPDYLIIRSTEAPWQINLAPMLNVLISESVNALPGAQIALDRICDLLFILILRQQIADSNNPSGLAAALSDPRIRQSLDALHASPEQDWTVASLAQVAHMSRSAFAERFKSLMGVSPMSYQTSWRMQCAYRWLADDGITVWDAAGRCGYATEAAFAKAFKRELGISPGKVRSGQVS